jgi:hypothetical protein
VYDAPAVEVVHASSNVAQQRQRQRLQTPQIASTANADVSCQ